MTTANNKLSSVEMWRNEDSIRRRIINKMAARQQALTSKEQQQKQQQQKQHRPLVRASGTITTHQKSTVAVTREEGSRVLPNGRPPPTEEDRDNSDSGYNKHQRHLLPIDGDVRGGERSLDYRQSLLKLQYMRSHQAKLHHVMHQPNYDDGVAADDGETRLTSSTSQYRLHPAADKSGAGKQSTNAIVSRDAQKSSNRMLSVLRASESRRQQHEQLADENQRRLAQHQQRPYAYEVTSPPVMTSPLTISYHLSLLQRNYSPPPVPPNSSRYRTDRLQGNHHHDNDSPPPSSLLVVYLPSVDYPDDNVDPFTPALVTEACNDNDSALT